MGRRGCIENSKQIQDKDISLGGREMRDTSNIHEEDYSEQNRTGQGYT